MFFKNWLPLMMAFTLANSADAAFFKGPSCATSLSGAANLQTLLSKEKVSVTSIFESEFRSHLVEKQAGVPISDLAIAHTAKSLIASGRYAMLEQKLAEMAKKFQALKVMASNIGSPAGRGSTYSKAQLRSARELLGGFENSQEKLEGLRTDALQLNQENQEIDTVHSELIGIKQATQEYLVFIQAKKSDVLNLSGKSPGERFDALLDLVNHEITLTSRRLETLETLIQDSSKKQIKNVLLIDDVLASADIDFTDLLLSAGIQDDAVRALTTEAKPSLSQAYKAQIAAFKKRVVSSSPYRVAHALIHAPIQTAVVAGVLFGVHHFTTGPILHHYQQAAYARSVESQVDPAITKVFTDGVSLESRDKLLSQILQQKQRLSFQEAFYLIENMSDGSWNTTYTADDLGRDIYSYMGKAGAFDDKAALSPYLIFANRILWITDFRGAPADKKMELLKLLNRRLDDVISSSSGVTDPEIVRSYYQTVFSHRAQGLPLQRNAEATSQQLQADNAQAIAQAIRTKFYKDHEVAKDLQTIQSSQLNSIQSLTDYVGRKDEITIGEFYSILDRMPVESTTLTPWSSIPWLKEFNSVTHVTYGDGSVAAADNLIQASIMKVKFEDLSAEDANLLSKLLSQKVDAVEATTQDSEEFKGQIKNYLLMLLSRKVKSDN